MGDIRIRHIIFAMTAFVRINVMMNLFILYLSEYRNSMQSIKNQGKNTLTAMDFL